MTDPSEAPPARIFTSWGTVLYVDVASGQLRHGAIDTSPKNAVFVADPAATGPRRQGWFMFDTGEGLDRPEPRAGNHSVAIGRYSQNRLPMLA